LLFRSVAPPIDCFEELMPAPFSEAAIEKAAAEFKVPAN
jgi:hypothetical protein